MAKSPFFFREEKNQVFYHDLKVFMFGTDVTPWITSQVTLQRADRDGINSLTFSLSNAYRAFEITGENLGMDDPNTFYDEVGDPKTVDSKGNTGRAGKFRLTDPYSIHGHYSELAKAKIYTLKKQISGTSRNVKFGVASLGPVVGTGFGAKLRSIKNENSNNATSEVTDRYPMSLGSLVFHKYDPVRLFVKNPLTRDKDEWICAFTGYLDTKPFTQNYVTGDSVINITCQDIRLIMNNMRVQVNCFAQVGNENIAFFGGSGKGYGNKDFVPLDSGLFADLVVHKATTHILGGQTWKGSMDFLIFGSPSKGGSRYGGIGKLKSGLTFEYDPAKTNGSNLLEDWNNLINFGVTPFMVKDDVKPLVPEGSLEADASTFTLVPKSAAGGKMGVGTFLTSAQMYALGTATIPDGAGSPDAAKVHYLIPAAGTPARNTIEYSAWTRIDMRVEFQSRLELLNKLCKNVDYQMYVSGMGDLIIEFPMYDFQPTDYNDAYNNLYTFTNHISSDNINDEGGTPVTALEITSRTLEQHLQAPGESAGSAPVGTDTEKSQTIFSSIMASRFGPIIETYDVPGVTEYSKLVQLGYIEFNKRLANFNMFDMNTEYRPPLIGVNRPIYHVRKQRFGISRSVSYSWKLLEEAKTEISLLYTRKREGNSFRFITGGERQPISYRTIYGGVKTKGQGVNDTYQPDNKPVPDVTNNPPPYGNTSVSEGNS